MSEEFEKCVADLKRNIKQSLKKNDNTLQNVCKRKISYATKIELIKGELLRLEARRAQLELCERSSELEEVEKKIILKKKNYLNVLIGKSIKI